MTTSLNVEAYVHTVATSAKATYTDAINTDYITNRNADTIAHPMFLRMISIHSISLYSHTALHTDPIETFIKAIMFIALTRI